jgi:hypothetical protein
MEEKSKKPRKVPTSQNPVVPQDENPLGHPEKTKKEISDEKKKKDPERAPVKGHDLI